jgi:hypothetical protein
MAPTATMLAVMALPTFSRAVLQDGDGDDAVFVKALGDGQGVVRHARRRPAPARRRICPGALGQGQQEVGADTLENQISPRLIMVSALLVPPLASGP